MTRSSVAHAQGHTAQQTVKLPATPHTLPGPQSASDEQAERLQEAFEAHTAPGPECVHVPLPAAKHTPSPHAPQPLQALPPQLGIVDVPDDEVVVLVVVVVVVGDPGSGGQVVGGGAFFFPTNLPGWSFAAVDGGDPADFADAAAHQPPPPNVSVAATVPWEGSSSV